MTRAALRVVRRRAAGSGGVALSGRAARRSSSSCRRPTRRPSPTNRSSGVWRYRGWLPPVDPVTLGEPTTALVELPGRRRGTSSPSSRAACRPARSRTAGPRDRVVAAGPGRARDRRRLVRERRGVVRGLCGAGRAPPRGCSCRPTPRRPSCSRPARTAPIVVAVPGPRSAAGEAARARARGRRPRGRLRLAPLAAGVPRRHRDVRLRGLRAAGRPGAGCRRRAARRRHAAARRPPRLRAPARGRA